MMPRRRPIREMQATFPATLEAIEPFFREFRLRHRNLGPRADIFRAELLVREALTNAVVHGCRQDPEKQVRVTVRTGNGRLMIAVADDGEGFDWRISAARRAQPGADSGRGLEILRTYATRVRFNTRGNSVTILKRF